MKKYIFTPILAAVAAFALLHSLPAKSADIVATAGDNPVIVVSPGSVFGVAHAADVYTAIATSKGGLPYVPPGYPAWIKYTNAAGVAVEEHVSNYTLRTHDVLANERWLATPWRLFPPEAVEAVDIVTNGQPVTVISRARGTAVEARVVAVNFPDDYLVLDYPAIDHDSASRVVTARGVVGLIAKTIREPGQPPTGSICIVPGLNKALAGTRPAPVPEQPIPVAGTTTGPPPVVVAPPPVPIPSITPDEAYKNGLKDGRAKLLHELADFLKTR
jgi:hypothetical protein